MYLGDLLLVYGYFLGRREDQYMRACSRDVDIDVMRDGGLKYAHDCSL